MDLQSEIDKRAQEIHTDAYSMSINEAVSMYESGDLEVHPEFQRIFRWTISQQSRLIESIFLGIPVPPIFVAQRQDGVWDVVDGVQRLSTIFRFVGVLKDDKGSDDPPQALAAGEYLIGLNGLLYGADEPDKEKHGDQAHNLNDAQRRVFKRARLDFQIVQKESDDQAKFDLFQRLNSGTRLSEQEARNCLAVMLDPTFARWVDSLAEFAPFENVLSISDRQEMEGYANECVLRFLATTQDDVASLRRMGDVGEYLTVKMREFASDAKFDRDAEKRRFEGVFSLLDEALGSDVFRRHSITKDSYGGRFSVSAFEAIGSGVARNWNFWQAQSRDEAVSEIRSRVPLLWRDDVFAARSGGGKAAERRISWMVEVGDRIFSETPDAHVG